MTPLTDRQREALDYLKSFYGDWGYFPSVREIGEAMGINSPNGVMCHLRALEAKGYLSRPRVNGKAMARAWVVVEKV